MLRIAVVGVLLGFAYPAQARMVYPEWMSAYDLARSQCHRTDISRAESRAACGERDQLFFKLKDAGFVLQRDATNPNGYVWAWPTE